jgi:DNA-binding transcriptional LysR family regulator
MDRFKLMQTYEAAVRNGGYTRAARELGVTRAMVSKRIMELERVLSVKLLNRTTQRIGTTAAGDDYYKSCVSMLAELRAVEERLLARRRDFKGELRILSSTTFGEIILAHVVARFCHEHPGLRPYLALRDLGTDEQDLISRGFDLSIRPQQVISASLISKPIAALPRVIVAAPAYLERVGAPVVPEDLREHNCLMPNGDDRYEWSFAGPRERTVVQVSGSFRSSSNAVIRHAVLEGLGVALLGQYVVDADINAGRLVRLLSGYALPERTLYVLYQKDRYQPLRTRVFIDYLSVHMRERLPRGPFERG